jgi:hypothetical protein
MMSFLEIKELAGMKKVTCSILILFLLIGCQEFSDNNRDNSNYSFEDNRNENNEGKHTSETKVNEDKLTKDTITETNKEVKFRELVSEEYQHLIPQGYLKDTYWTGDDILDKAIMTHIIIEDQNSGFKGLVKDEIAKEYLSENMYDMYVGTYHSYDKEFTEKHILYLNNIIYDIYRITPFYTEFDEYIGVEYIVRIKGFENLSDEEAYKQLYEYSGKYYVDDAYYRIGEEGKLELDKEGYYRRRYENTVDLSTIKMIEGELIELNELLDYSFDDYGSQARNQYSMLGYTKWTSDEELNRALLAFVIDISFTLKRVRKEYITDFINNDDAEDMIEFNKQHISFEVFPSSASEIKIMPYNKEDIYVVEVMWANDDSEEDTTIDNLFYKYYVHKQQDGKYKVYGDLNELEN